MHVRAKAIIKEMEFCFYITPFGVCVCVFLLVGFLILDSGRGLHPSTGNVECWGARHILNQIVGAILTILNRAC